LKDVEELKEYIKGELNVKELILTSDDTCIVTTAKPDYDLLGKRLRKDLDKVKGAIKDLTHEQLEKFQKELKMELHGHVITSEEMIIVREYKGDQSKNEAAWDDSVLTVLELTVDEEMVLEGQAREIVNRIQKLRKKAGIIPTDPIEIFYEATGSMAKVIASKANFIRQTVGAPCSPLSKMPAYANKVIQEEQDVSGSSLETNSKTTEKSVLTIVISRLDFAFGPTVSNELQSLVLTRDYTRLLQEFKSKGKVTFNLDSKDTELEFGKDVFSSVEHLLGHNTK